MADGDRNAIKAHIVKLLCECGSFEDIRQQLSQALSLMAASDFPGKWESLLPEIVKNYQKSSKQFEKIHEILHKSSTNPEKS